MLNLFLSFFHFTGHSSVIHQFDCWVTKLGHVGVLIAFLCGIYFLTRIELGLLSWELGISVHWTTRRVPGGPFQGLMSPFLHCAGFGGVFVSDASLSLTDALQPLLAT